MPVLDIISPVIYYPGGIFATRLSNVLKILAWKFDFQFEKPITMTILFFFKIKINVLQVAMQVTYSCRFF